MHQPEFTGEAVVRSNQINTKWRGIFPALFVCAFFSADLSAQSIEISSLPSFDTVTAPQAAITLELPIIPKMAITPTVATTPRIATLPKLDFAAEFNDAYQNLEAANAKPASPVVSKSVKAEIVSSNQKAQSNDFPTAGGNFLTGNEFSLAKTTLPSKPDPSFPTVNDTSPTWWKNRVNQPLHPDNQTETVDTNSLVFAALKNSPRIQAISQNPLIRELQVIEADSDFDAVSFVRSNFADRNDPVGNTLTTGGAPFLQDNIWSGEIGLRKKTRTGATIQASELMGFKNSNSTFFLPQDQGTATLALNVTQPLMRGRGRYYNRSQILIAQATGGAAWDTFSNELQDELQATTQAYWRLYYDRSVFLQKKRNIERSEQILAMLEGRSELDSLPSQIARARSAVQTRKIDLANAFRDVRNSETEIRRRIADRNWLTAQNIEMLPMEPPLHESLEMPLEQVVRTAIEQRREIKEVMQRAKIAGVQTDISVNELMPELSLLLGTYVSGLKGGSALGQALVQQFDVAPGYNVGIQFEMPYQNRAARSRLAQRKLQLAKIKAEVDETIQKVIAESQIALRRVNSALQTLTAAEAAIVAARQDLEQNQSRWETFGLVEGDLTDGQNPTTMLNQVLDSQERLTSAELIYAQGELELKNAEVALQRTMGTLLMHENVDFAMIRDGDTPEMNLEKN